MERGQRDPAAVTDFGSDGAEGDVLQLGWKRGGSAGRELGAGLQSIVFAGVVIFEVLIRENHCQGLTITAKADNILVDFHA